MINNISIIIPIYNAENFIQETLISVSNQTFKNFEVLLLDDGSTDNTLSILENYVKIDNRFKVFTQSNIGKPRSTNKLATLAKYDWICLLDHDDLMRNDKLQYQILFHNNNNIDASSSNCLYIDEFGNFCGKQKYFGLSNIKELNERVSNKDLVICAYSGLLISKYKFLNIGGLRNEFWPACDFDFINRFIESGNKLLIINEYLMSYRVHKSSISVKFPIKIQFAGLYASYCHNLRMQNLDEVSFNTFKQIFNSKSFFYKFNWYKNKFAMNIHKNAGLNFYRKNYIRFLLDISIAFILWPTYVISSFNNQFKK
jgi:glycosyltransferase involved in cell wall biosynthesis